MNASTIDDQHTITLADGRLTVTRRVRPDDHDPVQAFHRRCSVQARASRYHAGMPRLSPGSWRHLSNPDAGISLITTPADAPDEVVAWTNAMHGPDHTLDLGLLVVDDWQRRGLGTALAHHVAALGHSAGFSVLTAHVSSTNRPIHKILRRLGAQAWTITGPTVDICVPLRQDGAHP